MFSEDTRMSLAQLVTISMFQLKDMLLPQNGNYTYSCGLNTYTQMTYTLMHMHARKPQLCICTTANVKHSTFP